MRRTSVIAFVLVLLVLFAALFWLDLTNRGLAWRVLYAITGEEDALGQVRGAVEWGGTLLRPAPHTDPFAPVNHLHDTPYGVNTFLQLEADPAVRARSMGMIADAGFTWIRQQFPWEDIEIHGRGDFEDRRNVDAIGVVSAWDKYDQIVALAAQHGVHVLARIDNPPAWTRANPNESTLAPPDDWADYDAFLTAVAERYRGRVRHYQIWNEPNIYPEWGENPVNPEEYTAVLCRAYALLKAIDPAIVVHAAALSPTVSLTDRNLSDLIFLQRMYQAGASGCFDVMHAQGYGFFSGPTDQRLRTTTLNFARPLYIRDIMVANGDAGVPLWISEAGWNPVDAPDVPDMPGRENFGAVTPVQAAQYMTQAYTRITREWNWIGVMMIWHWKRPDESERLQPFYYFRMVEPDHTPMPIYYAMRDHIADELPILYAGTHQADHRFIQRVTHRLPGYDPESERTAAEGAQFGTARRGETFMFSASGTHIFIRWKGTQLDISDESAVNRTFTARPDADGWTTSLIHDSLLAQAHTFTVQGGLPFLLDSVLVLDRTAPHLIPLIAAVGAVAVFKIALVILLLWRGQRAA
jgi:hypothetical protein